MSLAWVDFGQQHREDMDRLLDAFRDGSVVDELGIGTIRDAFSEMLYPRYIHAAHSGAWLWVPPFKRSIQMSACLATQ